MLGNLLGHIDALLSDNLEDSFSQAKLNAVETVEGRETQLNDKRKGSLATSHDSHFCRVCHGKNNKRKDKYDCFSHWYVNYFNCRFQ